MCIIPFRTDIGREVLLPIFGEEQDSLSEQSPEQLLISQGFIQEIVGIEMEGNLFFKLNNLQFVINVD
jgi:hypothetical protein